MHSLNTICQDQHNNQCSLAWEYSIDPDNTELQWLEHLWDCENMFETGVVPANEC